MDSKKRLLVAKSLASDDSLLVSAREKEEVRANLDFGAVSGDASKLIAKLRKDMETQIGDLKVKFANKDDMDTGYKRS